MHRPEPDVRVSAKTGSGEEDVRRLIARELTGEESLRDPAAVSNLRHIGLLDQARTRLAAAERLLSIGHASEEFLLADLQAARSHLEEIVGIRTSEELLEHIFSKFCVGK
jgi:tRNA modification GTPase